MKTQDDYFDFYTALVFMQDEAEEFEEQIVFYKGSPEIKIDYWTDYYSDFVDIIEDIYAEKLDFYLKSGFQ